MQECMWCLQTDGTPGDLPSTLLTDLSGSLPHYSRLEGYIRPGCTHLSINVRMRKCDFEKFVASKPDSDVAKKLFSLWSHQKCVQTGLRVQIEDKYAFISSSGEIQLKNELSKPRIFALKPCSAMKENGPICLKVAGMQISGNKDVAFCRQNGALRELCIYKFSILFV